MSEVVAPGWPAPMRPRLAPTLMLVLTVATGAAVLAHVGADVPAPAAPAPAPLAVAPVQDTPRWIEIVRPVQIYSLEAPELGRLPLIYTARRLSRGDVREDRLAFGSPGGERPMLRLALLRGASPGRPPTLQAAVTALLAADSLKASIAPGSGTLATRFGTFGAASVTLDAPATSMACNGFHLAVANPSLAITGVACAGASQDLSRAGLSCLIDRLDLASAGEDLELSTFFADSELRRNAACRGMRLGPDEVHAPWLDDKPATPPSKIRHHEGITASIGPS